MTIIPELPKKWEPKHITAAKALGTGKTIVKAAAAAGVSEASICRWKRNQRFNELIDSFRPASQVEQAILERRENFDLLQEARDAEILLTVELRDALEQVIRVVRQRLESMTDPEIDQLALRHLSPLLKCFSDGFSILQNSHDRLTGYGMLLKELEAILESGKAEN